MTASPSARLNRSWAFVAFKHPEGAERCLAAGGRVIPECHFSVQLNHFIPGFPSYSVAVFLKRQSDVSLAEGPSGVPSTLRLEDAAGVAVPLVVREAEAEKNLSGAAGSSGTGMLASMWQAHSGLYPISTLEAQLLNMIGNLI